MSANKAWGFLSLEDNENIIVGTDAIPFQDFVAQSLDPEMGAPHARRWAAILRTFANKLDEMADDIEMGA